MMRMRPVISRCTRAISRLPLACTSCRWNCSSSCPTVAPSLSRSASGRSQTSANAASVGRSSCRVTVSRRAHRCPDEPDRQVGGRRLTHGFALDPGRCGRWGGLALGGLVLERGVGQDGVKQHGRLQTLGRRAEAPAIEAGDLSIARLVPCLLELDLGLQTLDRLPPHQHRIAYRRGVGRGHVRGF